MVDWKRLTKKIQQKHRGFFYYLCKLYAKSIAMSNPVGDG
jgi:hypothetical protein